MDTAPWGPGKRWALLSAVAMGRIIFTTLWSPSGAWPWARRRVMIPSSDSPSSHSRARNGTKRPSGRSRTSTWRGRTTSVMAAESRNISSASSRNFSRKIDRCCLVICSGILRHLSATGARKAPCWAR